MPDYKIDPLTGDIAQEVGVPLQVSGTALNAQRLDILLNTIKGEWFWENTRGIPFFDGVLGTKSSKSVVDSIYYKAISKETYIDSIISFTSTVDKDKRIYNLAFIAKDTSGNTIGGSL